MHRGWLLPLATVLLLVTSARSAIAPASSSNANIFHVKDANKDYSVARPYDARCLHYTHVVSEVRTYMHQVLEAAQNRQENRFQSFLSPSRNLPLPWDVGTLAVKSAFDDTIRSALESVKKVLAVAFEPLEIDRISLDIDAQGIKSKGYLRDVSVHQLSEFRVDDVQSNIERLIVSLGVTFENLDIYAYYDVDAKSNDHLHVFGNGTMKMRLYDLQVNTSTKLGYKDQHFQVNDLRIDVGLARTKIIMDNLMGGGAIGDVTNDIISDVLPAYVDEFREEISRGASAAAKKAINDKLSTLSLDDLLELAGVPKPTPKPPIHT